MSRTKSPRPFKRNGLHRVECDGCDGYLYATIAQLEARKLPLCACGGMYLPTEYEACELLALDNAPAIAEYRTLIESIWHGQEPHGHRLDRKLQEPHDLAMSRIVQSRAAAARKRQVSALNRGPLTAVTRSNETADIPF